MDVTVVELADRFDAAVADVVDIIERCSDKELRTICPAEGWSVAIVADHIAVYMPIQREWIGKVANDAPMLPFTDLAIDTFNAWRAEEQADVTKSEIIALLRRNHADARDFILNLSDDQLRRSRPINRIYLDTASRDDRDVARCVERTLIAHVRHHYASIAATLAESDSG